MHNMNTFFSSVDNAELHDNTKSFPMYLSLITNNKLDFCAKLCFTADLYNKRTYRGTKKEDIDGDQRYYIEEEKKDVLHIMDCKIEIEGEQVSVPEWFSKRVDSLLEDKKKVVSTVTNGYSDYPLPTEIELLKDVYKLGDSDFIDILKILYNEKTSAYDIYTINYRTTDEISKSISTNKLKIKHVKSAIETLIADIWKDMNKAYKQYFKYDDIEDLVHYRLVKLCCMNHLAKRLYIWEGSDPKDQVIIIKKALKSVYDAAIKDMKNSLMKVIQLDETKEIVV